MSIKHVVRITAVLVFALAVSSSSFAGWEVFNLHPAGSAESAAYGVSGGQAVGYVNTGGKDHAALWSGTAAGWVDLNPEGCSESRAYGISGGQQVGRMGADGSIIHPALWNGTAASCEDLLPEELRDLVPWAEAYDISGDSIVGLVDCGYIFAGIWRGPGHSLEDIGPLAVSSSHANGISGDQAVGVVDYGGEIGRHATLWSPSWMGRDALVDLNPQGSTSSYAYDVSDGQQVGVAGFPDPEHHSLAEHASLWTGTAESWVDLCPAWARSSSAQAVSGGWQAGHVNGCASLWHGTAESLVNLHSLLGAGYGSSYAQGIEVSGNDIWVVGYAYDSATSGSEAIMWHYSPNAVPEPSSFLALGSGLLALGGLIRRRRG